LYCNDFIHKTPANLYIPFIMMTTEQLSPSPTKKILIIGPSWVGDMVMAQSLFMEIKQLHPNAIIDVLAPGWSRPILDRMPEINSTIAMPVGHGSFSWKTRKTIGKQLKRQGYSQSIVLPNSWKSALIPWFADIPLRTGWKGEARYFLLNDLRTLDKEALPLMVERFVALAHPKYINNKVVSCPSPKLVINEECIPALQNKFSLSIEKPIIILCPGAEFGPAKQWPAEHYATTATTMIQQGWQTWIMGSKSDLSVAEDIICQIPTSEKDGVSNFCGKTSLEEAIDMMSLANHVVSNDSGLMHIASALDKPLTVVYGATSPEFTPPLSKQANIVAVSVDCGPCFQRHCPEGHHKCMNSLEPSKVIQALNTSAS